MNISSHVPMSRNELGCRNQILTQEYTDKQHD